MPSDDPPFPPALPNADAPRRDPAPSRAGLAHCLRMLAEEAALLRLPLTQAALRDTLVLLLKEAAPSGCAPPAAARTRLH